jgi:hypothetical protein
MKCGPQLITWSIIVGVIALKFAVGLTFGRRRYKWPLPNRPSGAGLENTGERYFDPLSGETVSVWYDPQTGERHYVNDTAASAIAPAKRE